MTTYVLTGKTPKRADYPEWKRWFETADRVVARTQVGDAKVSTVFLGIAPQSGSDLPMFETMIFGGKHHGFSVRRSTWEEAKAQHALTVLALLEGDTP